MKGSFVCMPGEVTEERTSTKTNLKRNAPIADGGPTITMQDFRVAKGDEGRSEAVSEEETYLLMDQDKNDPQTGFGAINRLLSVMRKGGENREVLLQEDVQDAYSWILKTSGGKREEGWELAGFMAEMVTEINERNPGAERAWNSLTSYTDKQVEEIRAEKDANPELGMIYDFFKAHKDDPEKPEGDPAQLRWAQVVVFGKALKEVEENGKMSQATLREVADFAGADNDQIYQKLLAKEGYAGAAPNRKVKKWLKPAERKRFLGEWLRLGMEGSKVDVQGFWKKQLLEVVEYRLGRMRSQAVARVGGSGDKENLSVTRPEGKKKEKYNKAYSSALMIEDVAGGTTIGQFLDEMGKGSLWRGKAMLDTLYWSIYRGVLMDSPAAMSRGGRTDIMSDVEKSMVLEAFIREMSGADALSKMVEDDKFYDAFNTLFLLKDDPYSVSLQKLAEKYEFDVNDDLPQFVTDAAMLGEVIALDIYRNLSTSDRRYQVYLPAAYYALEYVTDAWGTVIAMMGKDMIFTESPLAKMLYFSPKNWRFDYNAFVEDERDFDPEIFDDQKDKTWQNVFMFMIQVRDPSLRRIIMPEDNATIDGEPMTATPGQVGEYVTYNNERMKGGEYDHRRKLYGRVKAMYDQHLKMVRENGTGKLTWNEIDEDVLGRVTDLETRVLWMLEFLEDNVDVTVGGVRVQTNGEEIFYNDELQAVLARYLEDRTAAEWAGQQNDLEELVNMREVLRDHRALGLTWDLRDPEVISRLEKRKDFKLVHLYDSKGGDSKGKLLGLVSTTLFSDISEMEITPRKIFDTIRQFAHRYHPTLYYKCMHRIYLFSETVVMSRMSQMEIPSAEAIEKAVDPMGEFMLGAWSVYDTIGGEMEKMGYAEKLTKLRLVMTEQGLYQHWNDAIRSMVERLVTAKALQWAQTRDTIFQQRAFVNEFLALFENPLRPIESFQTPDAVLEGDGKSDDSPIVPRRRQLIHQDMNEKHVGNFFDVLDFDESMFEAKTGAAKRQRQFENMQKAGVVFGGMREAKVTVLGGVGAEVKLLEKPNGKTQVRLDGEEIKLSGAGEVGVLIEWTDDWSLVSVRKDRFGRWDENELAWLDLRQVNREWRPQGLNDDSRQRESMVQGGRFVWHYNDGVDQWQWSWVLGEWANPERKRTMSFYQKGATIVKANKKKKIKKRVAGGYYRVLKTGTKDQTTVKGVVEEAVYPFMLFQSLEKQKEYHDERASVLFSLQFGKGREAFEGGKGEVPLPGDLYDSADASASQLLRGAKWIQERMRYVERKAACDVALHQKVANAFGDIGLGEATKNSFKESYNMIMAERLGGEDKEAVEKFINSISFFSLFSKERDWAAYETEKNTSYELGNVFTLAGVKLLGAGFKLGPVRMNVPIALGLISYGAITAGASELALAVNTLGFWFQVTPVVAVWLGASVATTIAEGWLMGRIKLNVDLAHLDKVPFLNKFDPFIPRE